LGLPNSNARGIWKGTPGNLSLVAQSGALAPGTEPGVTFSNSTQPFTGYASHSLNNAGNVAFIANLSSPSGSTGAWSDAGPLGLHLVWRLGQQAPGTTAGTVFWQRPESTAVLLGSDGLAVVRSVLSGPAVTGANDSGIWRELTGGGLLPVVIEGTQAVDAPLGVLYGDVVSTFEVNSRGRVAFNAALAGPGVDATNNRAIFAEDVGGVLRMIVRLGDVLDVDDGPGVDLRTISALRNFRRHGNGESGFATTFNRAGQLSFTARFTDGSSGVFVSNIATVPEPAAPVLSIMIAVCCMAASRGVPAPGRRRGAPSRRR
jgi:hypothetical protein